MHSSAQIMKQQQQKREGRVVRRLEPRVPGSCSAPWRCLSPSPFPRVLTCAWGRRRTGRSACVSIHCCHLLGGIGSLSPRFPGGAAFREEHGTSSPNGCERGGIPVPHRLDVGSSAWRGLGHALSTHVAFLVSL